MESDKEGISPWRQSFRSQDIKKDRMVMDGLVRRGEEIEGRKFGRGHVYCLFEDRCRIRGIIEKR